MGSYPSKNLQQLTVSEVQVHVAGLGEAYQQYAPAIERNAIDGDVLYSFSEDEFEEMLTKDLKVTSPAQRKKLIREWKAARETQAKRQKLIIKVMINRRIEFSLVIGY